MPLSASLKLPEGLETMSLGGGLRFGGATRVDDAPRAAPPSMLNKHRETNESEPGHPRT
jgi:hypothetical protein